MFLCVLRVRLINFHQNKLPIFIRGRILISENVENMVLDWRRSFFLYFFGKWKYFVSCNRIFVWIYDEFHEMKINILNVRRHKSLQNKETTD